MPLGRIRGPLVVIAPRCSTVPPSSAAILPLHARDVHFLLWLKRTLALSASIRSFRSMPPSSEGIALNAKYRLSRFGHAQT